jgi:hypothetical protein
VALSMCGEHGLDFRSDGHSSHPWKPLAMTLAVLPASAEKRQEQELPEQAARVIAAERRRSRW